MTRALVATLWLLAASTSSGQTLVPCYGDHDDNGRVTIGELVLAVGNALNGCPGTTPLPTITPAPSETPLPDELSILREMGSEWGGDIYGCTSRAKNDDTQFEMTCEIPTAFVRVLIDRYPNVTDAQDAMAGVAGTPIVFEGYPAFEEFLDGPVAPGARLTLQADRWVIETLQVTVFDTEPFREFMSRVLAEAVERGMLEE